MKKESKEQEFVEEIYLDEFWTELEPIDILGEKYFVLWHSETGRIIFLVNDSEIVCIFPGRADTAAEACNLFQYYYLGFLWSSNVLFQTATVVASWTKNIN